TSKESIEENNFIVFAAPKDTLTQQMQASAQEEEKSLDYNISLDLNVNPNAKLYIPIDFTQVKGDLAAAGNGDIKIAMDSKGKFSMIGTVAIDNGKFKFNIMDLMEKTFDIEQGGTLTWNGDPAGGILDLTAIYKTKASLASILGETYSKPVDVENIINITGQMTNPQPSFDIQLPNVDDQTREQVFMNIDRSDEKVMLEQTASLLLTNQFYLSQGNYQNNALQSGVTSSVMGMAFSQLSGMLTNMVKFVDVGLNYTTGEEALAGQMDLNVGKSFGKWDLSVNATLGGDATTSKTSDATNVIGDMSAKYKYTENLQFEVFNHSNANDFTKYNVSPYTQGIKLIYKHDYNTIKDIWQRKKKKDKQ
ncbi:MAG: translocation/assembly module TamB domain-containing protein, partial [Bacteroidales bacterium]|nr:translocation/assembly module TamB domain-containing protein [Bacteroidales bacterium]